MPTYDDLRNVGLSVARVSRMAGVPYQNLYRALNYGGHLSLEHEQRVAAIYDRYRRLASDLATA